MSILRNFRHRAAAAALSMAVLAGSFPVTAQAADTENVLQFGGHTYQAFYEGGLTWSQAKDSCEAKGGHLATITSEEECTAIENYLDSLGSDLKYAYWLGGTDREQEGVWTWLTGESWTMENWSYGEPNDDFGSEEDYLGMYTPAGVHGGDPYCWNDFTDEARSTGTSNMGFLCEWEEETDTPDSTEEPTEPDRWSFSNSYVNFEEKHSFLGTPWYRNIGYYITQDDYDRLVSSSRLPLIDKLKMDPEPWQYGDLVGVEKSQYNIDGNGKQFQEWGGSCYGMSSWVCLVGAGELSSWDVPGSLSTLFDYNSTLDVQSAINFYQWQQSLTIPSLATDAFMELPDQMTQLEKMQDLAEQDVPFILRYQWYQEMQSDGKPDEKSGAGHAVVGYGSQWGAYTDLVKRYLGDRIGDTVFTHRILIYDCAYPDDPDGAYDLYYSDDGVCAIPGHGFISTDSHTADSNSNNGVLVLASADMDVLNAVDFRTGEAVRPTVYDGLMVDYRLADAFSLTWDGGTDAISGFSSQSGEIPVAITAAATAEGDSVSADATAFLADADACTVSSDTPLFFRVTAGEHLTTVQADTEGQITFEDNGGARLRLDEKGTYQMQLAANEGTGTLDWEILEVSGEGNEVSCQPAEDGFLLTGEDLTGVTVVGSDGTDQIRLTIPTEDDTVLITDDNKAGELFLRADRNGNGSFETTVAASTSQDNPFRDVFPGDYYYDAVNWAVGQGITTGTTATTFEPGLPCTRGQMVTFLWRAAGSPAPMGGGTPFMDVPRNAYYADAVRWAVEKGITNGTEPYVFAPDETVTRSQTVTFLHRYAGTPAVSGGSAFTDVPYGSYYYDAVRWAAAKGITTGTSATEFSPAEPCTRGQIVTFLYRLQA